MTTKTSAEIIAATPQHVREYLADVFEVEVCGDLDYRIVSKARAAFEFDCSPEQLNAVRLYIVKREGALGKSAELVIETSASIFISAIKEI